MKVSKVVIIVVALHVLVIGGIFIFEGCTRTKTNAPEIASGASDEGTNNAVMPQTADTSITPPVEPVIPPANVHPIVTPPAVVAKTYVVKKGDTLWKIAKTEKVALGDLARANNLTKNSALKVNQKLLPVKAEATAVAVSAPAPVAPGMPVDAIQPTAPASGNSYTVKTGDSLWKIAKAEHVSVAAIKQANNLPSDSLKVNQKLVIPAAAVSAPSTGAVTPVANTVTPHATASYGEWQPGAHVENGQTIHTVDINENLSGIAKKYGVKVEDILKANNFVPGKRIEVGQQIKIPTAVAPVSATAPVTSATPAITTPIVSANN